MQGNNQHVRVRWRLAQGHLARQSPGRGCVNELGAVLLWHYNYSFDYLQYNKEAEMARPHAPPHLNARRCLELGDPRAGGLKDLTENLFLPINHKREN